MFRKGRFDFGPVLAAWRGGDADVSHEKLRDFEATKKRFPPGTTVRARLTDESGREFHLKSTVLEYAKPKLADGEPLLSVAVFAESLGKVGALLIGLDACNDISGVE